MMSANLAAEHGRNVYAVPGPIDRPSSEGCHKLLKDGAKLVTSADDILEDFEWLLPPSELPGLQAARRAQQDASRPPMEPAETAVYEAISSTESHIDEIITRTQLPAQEVSVLLLKLGFKHLVKQLPGQYYTRLS